MKYTLLALCIFFCSLTCHLRAQTDTITKSRKKTTRTIQAYEIPQKDTVSKYDDIVCTLTGDTLFTNKDVKIFIGQKLVVGRGSSDNGWFNNITLNSIFDWYSISLSILGVSNTETQEEKEIRINNYVKDRVQTEGTLYVKKIMKNGIMRPSEKFVVILRSRPGGPNTNYRCYIQSALKTGEIVFPTN